MGDQQKRVISSWKDKNLKILDKLGQKMAIFTKMGFSQKHDWIHWETSNTSARNMKFSQVGPFNNI